MKKSREVDNLLEECLQRMSRGESIEQCLAAHPQQAAELEPLLCTALKARSVAGIRPSPEFRDKARLEFRRAVYEAGQSKPHGYGFFLWHPRWATVAISALVMVLAGGGTLAAASSSMPDDVLYPVKLTTENVRVALTTSPIGKAELLANFADTRVTEIVKMAEKGKADKVEQASEKLDEHLQKIATLAAPERAQDKGTGTLSAPAPRSAAPPPTPSPRPSATPTPNRVAPAPAVTPSAKPTPNQVAPAAAPSTLAKRNDQEKAKTPQDKVKEIVTNRAAANSAALEAALKKAPETVKPALRKAIDKSDSGYKKAGEALDR